MRKYPRLAAVFPLALLAACPPTMPDRYTAPAPGVIEHYGEGPRVTVPQSARAGQPFTVEVVTFGGGCIAQGTTEVQVNGLTANVYPVDIETHGRKVTCTDDLRHYRHTATLTFAQAGTATVRIHGRRMPENAMTVIPREVTITAQ